MCSNHTPLFFFFSATLGSPTSPIAKFFPDLSASANNSSLKTVAKVSGKDSANLKEGGLKKSETFDHSLRTSTVREKLGLSIRSFDREHSLKRSKTFDSSSPWIDNPELKLALSIQHFDKTKSLKHVDTCDKSGAVLETLKLPLEIQHFNTGTLKHVEPKDKSNPLYIYDLSMNEDCNIYYSDTPVVESREPFSLNQDESEAKSDIIDKVVEGTDTSTEERSEQFSFNQDESAIRSGIIDTIVEGVDTSTGDPDNQGNEQDNGDNDGVLCDGVNDDFMDGNNDEKENLEQIGITAADTCTDEADKLGNEQYTNDNNGVYGDTVGGNDVINGGTTAGVSANLDIETDLPECALAAQDLDEDILRAGNTAGCLDNGSSGRADFNENTQTADKTAGYLDDGSSGRADSTAHENQTNEDSGAKCDIDELKHGNNGASCDKVENKPMENQHDEEVMDVQEGASIADNASSMENETQQSADTSSFLY